MAEILNGLSEHSCYAPLSGGQSIQLARHLLEQIRNVEATVESVRGDLNKTNEHVGSMQRSMLVTDACVATLQDNHRKSNDFQEKAKQDLTRLDKRSRQLQQSLEQLQEAFTPLKEGQTMMMTRFSVFERQMSNTEEKVKELDLGLEQNFNADKSDRGHVQEELQRFWDRYSKTVSIVEGTREKQRELENSSRDMKHDIERAFGFAQTLEERAAEQSKNMAEMGLQLQETTTRSQKLQEENDLSKALASDDRGSMKNLDAKVEKMSEGLSKTNGGLQNTQHQLSQQRKTIEDHKEKLRRAEQELERLNSGHLHASNSLRSLAVSLEETSNLAFQVKAGLKETNSMVLPNITMDTSSAGVVGTSAYTDLGSLSGTGGGGLRMLSSDFRARPSSKSRNGKPAVNTNGTPRVRPHDVGGGRSDVTMLPTQLQTTASIEDAPSGAPAGDNTSGQVTSSWGGY